MTPIEAGSGCVVNANSLICSLCPSALFFNHLSLCALYPGLTRPCKRIFCVVPAHPPSRLINLHTPSILNSTPHSPLAKNGRQFFSTQHSTDSLELLPPHTGAAPSEDRQSPVKQSFRTAYVIEVRSDATKFGAQAHTRTCPSGMEKVILAPPPCAYRSSALSYNTRQQQRPLFLTASHLVFTRLPVQYHFIAILKLFPSPGR